MHYYLGYFGSLIMSQKQKNPIIEECRLPCQYWHTILRETGCFQVYFLFCDLCFVNQWKQGILAKSPVILLSCYLSKASPKWTFVGATIRKSKLLQIVLLPLFKEIRLRIKGADKHWRKKHRSSKFKLTVNINTNTNYQHRSNQRMVVMEEEAKNAKN